MKKDFLEIGKIVGTHGVRGMVRIEPWADDASYLKNFSIFYKKDGTPLTLSRITPHGNIVLAAIKDVDTVEKAENFRGEVLSVKREDINLPDGRYLIDEIIGCEVYNSEDGVLLGKLTDVMKTGANDVWQITKDGKDYLVPVIPDVEINVDEENERITLKPLKGIFDDEN